jgi:hypothetical protein
MNYLPEIINGRQNIIDRQNVLLSLFEIAKWRQIQHLENMSRVEREDH